MAAGQRGEATASHDADIRPLTPIQHWFFQLHAPNFPNHWNQAMLLRVDPSVNRSLLERALRHLFQFHDAFYYCFPDEDVARGRMHRVCEPNVAVIHEDLSALPVPELRLALEKTAAAHQTGLNIQEGPLAKAVIFELGDPSGCCLQIVIHHLIVDILSWRILLEDLESLFLQLRDGTEPPTLPKTTSFSDWASRLAAAAADGEMQEDLAHWTILSAQDPSPLPKDFENDDNVNRDSVSIDVSLNKSQTTRLASGSLEGLWEPRPRDHHRRAGANSLPVDCSATRLGRFRGPRSRRWRAAHRSRSYCRMVHDGLSRLL